MSEVWERSQCPRRWFLLLGNMCWGSPVLLLSEGTLGPSDRLKIAVGTKGYPASHELPFPSREAGVSSEETTDLGHWEMAEARAGPLSCVTSDTALRGQTCNWGEGG